MAIENNSSKQHPIKHKRPVGQIMERGPGRFMVLVHSHTLENNRKKRYSKTWPTLKEADADLTRIVAEKNRGKGIIDTNENLGSFIQRFLSEAHQHRVRPHVHRKVAGAFRCWVNPFMGHKKVRRIQAKDILDLYATLREKVSERTGEKLSEATIQRVHVSLRMVFNWAMRTEQLVKNPMVCVEVRKPARQKMIVFSEQEIRQFLLEWEKYRTEVRLRIPYGPLFYMAYETGMRPEEYLGLQWSEVSLTADVPSVSVQRVVIRDEAQGGWNFDQPKTPSSVRNISISEELAELLRQHKQRIDQYKQKRGDRWHENDLVFPNQSGEPIYQNQLMDMFREIVNRMWLEPKEYRLYTFRHSMATHAIARGVHIKVVSERLGHASISRTLETYCHTLPNMQAEAVKTLSSIAYAKQEVEEPIDHTDLAPVVDLTEDPTRVHRPF